MLESRILSADVVGVGPAPIIMPAINAPALKAAESYPCAKTEATPMESHPYTKTRGVGPVTTQLTPGAQPASSKSAGAPGPRSCSPYKQLDVTPPPFTDLQIQCYNPPQMKKPATKLMRKLLLVSAFL